MHVEICPANELGQQTYPEPILIIKADREQEFKCVMYTDTGSVSIPLSELEWAINWAKEIVHSEGFYVWNMCQIVLMQKDTDSRWNTIGVRKECWD